MCITVLKLKHRILVLVCDEAEEGGGGGEGVGVEDRLWGDRGEVVGGGIEEGVLKCGIGCKCGGGG